MKLSGLSKSSTSNVARQKSPFHTYNSFGLVSEPIDSITHCIFLRTTILLLFLVSTHFPLEAKRRWLCGRKNTLLLYGEKNPPNLSMSPGQNVAIFPANFISGFQVLRRHFALKFLFFLISFGKWRLNSDVKKKKLKNAHSYGLCYVVDMLDCHLCQETSL